MLELGIYSRQGQFEGDGLVAQGGGWVCRDGLFPVSAARAAFDIPLLRIGSTGRSLLLLNFHPVFL